MCQKRVRSKELGRIFSLAALRLGGVARWISLPGSGTAPHKEDPFWLPPLLHLMLQPTEACRVLSSKWIDSDPWDNLRLWDNHQERSNSRNRPKTRCPATVNTTHVRPNGVLRDVDLGWVSGTVIMRFHPSGGDGILARVRLGP